MTAEVRRVEVDGLGLRAELGGAGEGPPILFLHGWLRSSEEWRFLAPGFGQVARTVQLDLPGCGGSDVPESAPWTTAWLADTVLRAADQLGLDRFRLFTHGLGGAVGFRICLDQPQRVDHHVACTPSTFANPLGGLRAKVFTRTALGRMAAELGLRRDRVRALLLKHQYHEPLRMTEELMDTIMAPLERPGAREAAWRMLLLDLDPGLGGALFDLTVPTTLIWGYSDRINLIDLAKTLEAEVEGVKLNQIPNTGYQLIEDRPLSVAIYAARALGLPLPQGIEDGHPRPGTANFT